VKEKKALGKEEPGKKRGQTMEEKGKGKRKNR
jgi:hypothetical protein